jgi:hypothetical protein
MEGVNPAMLVCGLCAVHAVGLASAWLARVSEGWRSHGCCKMLFLACMALVGLATMASFQLNAGGWFLSATMLPLMTLTVTCDLNSHASHHGRRPTENRQNPKKTPIRHNPLPNSI